ncbi:GWxTD domain-containing protein [Aquiflexum sp. TKW24L]|uniref:GWxTD domain-containing protein n=1 Tax=Aquiflexum sp. TKW24L TaxID=2942212 RepID=UPI0020BD5257|nr:GWxTD domain-containing protein [Aquiflexum sp. TKW24L]MCL6259697.1 GWxTD domain-containing protein [Aquiflexum sp. TKW24L]
MIGQKISNKLKPITGLLLFLFFIPLFTIAQQTLENTNQALRYSRYSRLSLKIIPIEEPNRTFLLQMPVEKIEDEIEFDNYTLSYGVVSSFQEPITDQTMIKLNREDLIRETDYHYYFEKRITIPEGQQMAIALLKAVDTRQGDEYFYHIDLISPFIFGHSNFGTYYEDNVPFDQNFLIQNEPIEFKGRGIVNLHTFFYPTTFDVPMPPMEIRPAPVPREVKVEYRGNFLANIPKGFPGIGYYFIQADTNSTQGVLLKTVHDIFPRVKDYDEMVDMVTYISTRREHELLKESPDKKIALDQYWYTLTKDTVSAKKLIREYFKQIEFANILFTDFKEGWKTDRGMVYVVMGPPNEVYFRLDSETWSYGTPESISKITFTFARVKNILTPSFYTLNRSRALQPEWFKSITLWRNAQMDF